MTQSSSTAPQRRRPKKQLPMWQRILFHWRFPVIIVLILMVLVGVAVGVIARKTATAKPADDTDQVITTQQRFDSAVLDAIQADADEIKPLVTLTAESELCSIDENGQVTLVVWHNVPDIYVKGQNVDLGGHDVWTFTDREILSWAKDHRNEIRSETGVLRLEQLIGLPENTGYTHFSVLKTDVSKVLRPAYQTDPTLDQMTTAFAATPDETYLSWFNGNILSSYFGEQDFPWTRLGYSCDWANGSAEYGLTEFLIPGTSTVSVLETYTNEEFRTLLGQGRDLAAT